MTTIYLDDFAEYEFKTIYQYLMSQRDTCFEIRLPKENVLDKDDQFFVFLDYYLAAYAGEKLSEVANNFSYYVPSVSEVSNFSFQLEAIDLEKLADVVYFIVCGYYNPDETEDEVTFYEKAAKFHESAWESFDAACWGLVTLAAENFD